jgi:hypothetical protein
MITKTTKSLKCISTLGFILAGFTFMNSSCSAVTSNVCDCYCQKEIGVPKSCISRGIAKGANTRIGTWDIDVCASRCDKFPHKGKRNAYCSAADCRGVTSNVEPDRSWKKWKKNK